MSACPYCGTALAKPPKRRARCPQCGEIIHVRSKQTLYPRTLLTTEELDALNDYERDQQVAVLNQYRERDLAQWAALREAYGLVYDVEILTMGERSCPACQALAGRVYTLEEVLAERPLPCRECTTTLRHKPWRNYCRCSYVARLRPWESPTEAPDPFMQRVLEVMMGGGGLEVRFDGVLEQVIAEWQAAGREPPPYMRESAPDPALLPARSLSPPGQRTPS